MAIDTETVKRVAFLSRLKVDDDKIVETEKEFNKILGWIEQLNEVDTDNVEPLVSVNQTNLECRADASAVMCGGFEHLAASSGGCNAHAACSNKQRSGLSRIDVVKLRFCEDLTLANHIEILPGTHPVAAYGVGKDLDAGDLVLCRKLTTSYRAESLGLKSVACQRCGAFTVNNMICRLAAAKLIIVHARQIIVN